jgi:hypothetical protein
MGWGELYVYCLLSAAGSHQLCSALQSGVHWIWCNNSEFRVRGLTAVCLLSLATLPMLSMHPTVVHLLHPHRKL